MRSLQGLAAAVGLIAASAVGPALASPTFNLTYISGTGLDAQAAFAEAANFWRSVFTDNVSIDLTVGTGGLGPGILGQAGSADGTVSYGTFRSVMAADVTSAVDAAALAHLPNAASFSAYMNYTTDNPNGSGSPTPFVDSTGANTNTIRMTSANAKALGLSVTPQVLPGCSVDCDSFIEFSNAFTYDYDRSNGITPGAFDFVGLAIHEIGHALGFFSGVDILDNNSTSPNFFSSNLFTYVTPLDMFRCSVASSAAGATIDFTADNRAKSFSTDNCATTLGTFSKGKVHGDGRQASHWEDNLGLGVMDPTTAPGELLIVTMLDKTAFDAIGWDLNVPEPGTLALGGAWALGMLALRRRRVVHL